MGKNKLFTKYEVSEMLDIPINDIELYMKNGVVTVTKLDRKGNLLVPEDQIQQIYDSYSTRYSYLSDDGLEELLHGSGYC